MKRNRGALQKKRCVCGCGRMLNPPATGHNFATGACTLRALKQSGFGAGLITGEEFDTAIQEMERREGDA